MKYLHLNYLKYNSGKGFLSSHIDALHATRPRADLYTDRIVEELIEKIRCAGIISTVSRNFVDLNRSPDNANRAGIQEYRFVIKEILNYLEILDEPNNRLIKPYLHLSFHGMKDFHFGPYAMEVGTVNGQSCSEEVKSWLKEILSKKTKEIKPEIEVIFDKKFIGDPSIVFHRLGDGDRYTGYGHNFHTFQIEISKTFRKTHWRSIVDIFSEVIEDFHNSFVIKS